MRKVTQNDTDTKIPKEGNDLVVSFFLYKFIFRFILICILIMVTSLISFFIPIFFFNASFHDISLIMISMSTGILVDLAILAYIYKNTFNKFFTKTNGIVRKLGHTKIYNQNLGHGTTKSDHQIVKDRHHHIVEYKDHYGNIHNEDIYFPNAKKFIVGDNVDIFYVSEYPRNAMLGENKEMRNNLINGAILIVGFIILFTLDVLQFINLDKFYESL